MTSRSLADDGRRPGGKLDHSRADSGALVPLIGDPQRQIDHVATLFVDPFARHHARVPEAVVLLHFPDMAAAKAWYDSPAYHAARQHRFQGADYRFILFDGL